MVMEVEKTDVIFNFPVGIYEKLGASRTLITQLYIIISHIIDSPLQKNLTRNIEQGRLALLMIEQIGLISTW